MARNGLTVLANRWSRVDSTGEAREAMARVRARVRVFMEEGGGVLIEDIGVAGGMQRADGEWGWGGEAERPDRGDQAFGLNCIGRRPTLPHTCACSTIGAERLNFRVRDGNGWDPLATITQKL